MYPDTSKLSNCATLEEAIRKPEKFPLTEREAYSRAPVCTNEPEDYENWRFIVRGFLKTVPLMKAHFDTVHKMALDPANAHACIKVLPMFWGFP